MKGINLKEVREVIKVRMWDDSIFAVTWNWAFDNWSNIRYIYL